MTSGPIVRITPDTYSIDDPDSVRIIYGHGTGFIKVTRNFPRFYIGDTKNWHWLVKMVYGIRESVYSRSIHYKEPYTS
jgi:hypothetical protein